MKLSRQIGVYIAASVLAAGVVPAALGSNGASNKSSSSLSLVVLGSSGGQVASTAPGWGDQVMFNVSTPASYPSLQLACYQGSSLVFNQIVGAFPSYGGSQVFTLSSPSWTSGAANCTAWLYTMSSSGKQTMLASLSFAVSA